ncbi:MAG: hypothetical protein JWM21_703 [Acidobacteria bacterium]|nr:hypothetical protein [Acidobacteriota bacterium]
MRIRKLHIKNLKSIENLELNFDEETEVTLLYGNNGVGKTTILEAISLIGHLSSMRRIAVPDALKKVAESKYERNSLFLERHNAQTNLPTESNAFDILKTNLAGSQNLESWFADFREPGAAAIYYEIKPERPLLSDTICFYIYFKQSPHSITQALSKKSSDDMEMNDLFAVVFSGSRDPDNAGSHCKDIDWLIEHFYKNTSHYVKVDGDDAGDTSLISKKPPIEDAHSIVSYINTDLNDFGRKNDVRESVKDILSDFGPEMLGRLALPFDGGDSGGEFHFKDDLNILLSEVIKDYTRVPQSEEQPLFKMTEIYCARPSPSAPYEVSLKAQRFGEGPERLDHMSAGENECFFIFMLLLGLPIGSSIVLLDEPDLHLTTYAKESFYKHVFKILQDKKCQVIISTHSLFAYSAHKASIEMLLIKREVIDGVPQHSAKFDNEYFYRLNRHYWRTARRALEVIDPKKVLTYRLGMLRDTLEDKQRRSPGTVGVLGNLFITLIPVSFLALAAVINDVIEKFFGQSLSSHGRWIGNNFRVFYLLIIAVALYWVVRFLFKRNSR